MKAPAFFFLLLLLPGRLTGQPQFEPGTVLTLEGDTLRGWLDAGNPEQNTRTCIFRETLDGPVNSYKPGDINAYRYDSGSYYVSKPLHVDQWDREVFLEYLIEGNLDLFYLREGGHSYYFLVKDDEFYPLTNDPVTVKEGGKTYQKESKKYIGMLRWLMQDAPMLAGRIEKAGFDHASMIGITTEYMEIMDGSGGMTVHGATSLSRKRSKLRLKFGIMAGACWSNLDMNGSASCDEALINANQRYAIHVLDDNTNFRSGAMVPVAGGYVNLSWNSASSIQLELQYLPLRHDEMHYDAIRIPLLYRYEIRRHGRTIPFFELGISDQIFIRAEPIDRYVVYEATAWNDPANIPVFYASNLNEELGISKVNLCILGGVGSRLHTTGQQYIVVQLRASYGGNTSRFELDGPGFSITRALFTDFSLHLSYMF
jgi:hypothetical protein